jgi:hypothetical protein
LRPRCPTVLGPKGARGPFFLGAPPLEANLLVVPAVYRVGGRHSRAQGQRASPLDRACGHLLPQQEPMEVEVGVPTAAATPRFASLPVPP